MDAWPFRKLTKGRQEKAVRAVGDRDASVPQVRGRFFVFPSGPTPSGKDLNAEP